MFKRKNENYSPVVSAGTRSPKGFLLVSVIAALCADICVSALLIWSGVPVLYWIFPVLAMAADALFLLGAVFTNFRFKYSVGELCAFVVFVCGIVVAENVVNLTGGTITLSAAAAVMWTASHLLSVICVVATAVHASKRIKGNKIAKIIAATLFCVLAAVSAGFYGLFVLGGGFFGQGGYDIRPLEYAYNGVTDSYSVTGVMQGKGGIVVIPETFNDKKVDEVSYKVFCAEGVTDVHMASADVKFTDVEELSHFGGGVNVHAEKEDAETLRNAFFSARNTTFRAYDLANSVVPVVDADEVYVTFSYDKDSYATVNGKVLPIWTGKKGETFKINFTYFENYSYVKYNSSSAEEGLYESYKSFDGKVLKELKYFDAANAAGGEIISGWGVEGNTVLDGAAIKNSVNVNVEFENVYRIKVQDDNDTKYEPGMAFKNLYINGRLIGYRYATAATLDGILNGIKNSRAGFTLSYEYGVNATMTPQKYVNFASSLAGSVSSLTLNTVYIYPVWKLNAPTINSIDCNAEGGRIVYGENLTVKALATSPAEGIDISYTWSGAYPSSGSGFTIQRIERNQGGTFNLTVTATGSGTSLTSAATSSVAVAVEKRPVYLDWTGIEAVTYDGTEHRVSFEVRARQAGSGILDADAVSVNLYSHNSFPVDIDANSATFKNAGTHTVGGQLSNGAAADNYYIVDSTESVQKVINKAPLDINWSAVTAFVYDGTEKLPSYTVSGGVNGENPAVNVSGATKYANAYSGNQYYTATATSSNNNYEIRSGATQRFTVAQAELTISWADTAMIYDGELRAPAPSIAAGVYGADVVSVSASGHERFTNAYTGRDYTAAVIVGNRNYKASEATERQAFTISPKSVSFAWESKNSFEYNGKTQYPVVVNVVGAADADMPSLLNAISYMGGGRNVSDGSRTVTGALNNANYTVTANAESHSFNITPKGITVTFTASENVLPYMGSIMTPTHTVWGRIGSEDVGLVLDGRGENAGDYTITPRATNTNYVVISGTYDYTIKKAPLIIEWGSAALTYNGQVHSPKATTKSTIYPRDDIEIVCTYDKADAMRKNVGSFVATATLVSNISDRPASNYEIIEGVKEEFFVNHVQLEIRVKNVNLVYNGAAQLPEVEIANKSAIIAGDYLELAVTGSATEAGTYTATVKLKNNNSEPAKNYKLKYESQFNTEINVTYYITAPAEPETQSVDLAEGGKRYYGDAETAEGGSL